MKAIPEKLRNELSEDADYKVCMKYGQLGHECQGKITFEHALIYASSQLQTRYAILAICEYGHGVNGFQDGGDMKKEVHEWIALNRATPEERKSISKAINQEQRLKYLNGKYGVYIRKLPPSGVAEPVKAPGIHTERPKSENAGPLQWFPISKHEQAILQKCMAFHKNAEGLRYSPFKLISMAIEEYGQKIDDIIKTHGTDI